MTELVLRASASGVLLSHMALYGLADILEAARLDVRVRWSSGGDPRPTVAVADADDRMVGEVVQQHAATHAAEQSWMQRSIVLKGSPRGLMSPRLTAFEDHETWAALQHKRHEVIDELTHTGAWLDLRFLAALGEPAYWSTNGKGERIPDDGASRFEMQPRNQGSEIVGSRLRPLSETVAHRDPSVVVAGIVGESVTDEAADDRRDSRTATGFAAPGPTDNALAWCALWGIGQLPIAMRVSSGSRTTTPAVTSGHAGRGRREWFYLPIWHDEWRPARLRTVLASQAGRAAASAGLDLSGFQQVDEAALAAARAWLVARGVQGLLRFPVRRFGSDNAPERRAMQGEPVLLTVPA